MSEQNRALRLDANHRLWIEEQPIPRPGEGEVLVRVHANGICGSDIHFYERGVLGPYVVREPYTPGHEACGEIVELGTGVRERQVGQAVAIEPGIPCRKCRFCKIGRYNQCPDVSFLSVPGIDGTFRDYVTIPADFAHPMPTGMTWEQGACIEPVAVAVHAINRARIVAGASVAVLGVGPIGLLVIQAALAVGAGKVLALDCQEMRLALAQALGALPIHINDEAALEAVLARTDGQGADFVFETAGHSSATALAPEIAATAGVIVQVGWPEIERVPYKIETILAKELDLRGINRYANAFPAAISLVGRGAIRVEPIITHRFDFEQSPTAFAYAHEHPDHVIKVVVLN
jgi:L-iditol 2-dehydrogenase